MLAWVGDRRSMPFSWELDLGIYVSGSQSLKINGVLQPERLLHPLHPRDGAEYPRSPLAKAIPLH